MALSGEEDESLRKLLAASERRKAAEVQRVRSKFNIIVLVGLPIFALFLGASMYLRRDGTDHATVETRAVIRGPSTGPASVRTDEEIEKAQFDVFRNEADRGAKTPGGQPRKGELLDGQNVHFAMELLNFLQPPPNRHSE